jgi:Fe-S cluster biosynthesis and repair protein YggX
MDLGIFIESVNYNITDFVTKYELITEEIDSLDPFDFINYQTLLANHQKLSMQRNEEQKKLAEAIEKEQK